MDIQQLRYFLKVAQHQNFTRAAEEFDVSQPALSQQILKLEDELGQPVFERQTRKVSLTPAGELLQKRAEHILFLVDEVRSEITDDGQTGRLNIGAIPTIAPYFLPGLLKAFRETAPLAQCIIHEEVTENLLKSCSQGEVDIGFLALPVEARYLDFETLFEEELLLVMPRDHRLTKLKRITWQDMNTEPFVLLNETHCLTDQVVTFCRKKTTQPVSTGKTNQLATVLELVALGHGVSLIPQMARAVDTSDQREYRSLAGEKPTRTIALCWNSYRYQTKLMKRFAEQVKEIVVSR